MEKELSMASNLETTLSCENTLDSNVNNHQNKRLRHSNSISPSRLKGVVAQVNGNWGAQIYTNHQRVWLGTFRSEREAAMAYDSAAIRLRSGDIHRNFAWTSITIQEPNFQKNMSTETVLNMIKDGSYLSKFADFLMMENSLNLNLASKHGKGNFLCTLLFQKELTPSDVGKLNRLVIPKKNALRYFPCISEDGRDDSKNGLVEDVQLFFFDRLLRSWKFRYCYWKSSQSFVFTRGWIRFVKEKELKEKDTVIFSMCECLEGGDHIKTFCMIDIVYKDRLDSNGKMGKRFQIGVAQDDVDGENEMDFEEEENAVHSRESEEEEATEVGSNEVEKKGIRIFGVQMF